MQRGVQFPVHSSSNCSGGALETYSWTVSALSKDAPSDARLLETLGATQWQTDREEKALQQEVRRFMHARWVVLIGDSSVRMLYHHLASLLVGRWLLWPPNVNNHYLSGSCFDSTVKQWKYTRADDCLEDFAYRGARITMLWTRFGDEAALAPLSRLLGATAGVPDVVLASIGAWWTHSSRVRDSLLWQGATSTQIEFAVHGICAFVERHVVYSRVSIGDPLNGTNAAVAAAAVAAGKRDKDVAASTGAGGTGSPSGAGAASLPNTYFHEAWAQPPLLIWAGRPSCGGNVHDRVSFGPISKAAIAKRRRWHYFERAATPKVCRDFGRADRHDCALGSDHPIGATLNAQVAVLLRTCEHLVALQATAPAATSPSPDVAVNGPSAQEATANEEEEASERAPATAPEAESHHHHHAAAAEGHDGRRLLGHPNATSPALGVSKLRACSTCHLKGPLSLCTPTVLPSFEASMQSLEADSRVRCSVRDNCNKGVDNPTQLPPQALPFWNASAKSVEWAVELEVAMLAAVRAGNDTSPVAYPHAAGMLRRSLTDFPVTGMTVLVGGSITPWVESMLVGMGAATVHTSDYQERTQPQTTLTTFVHFERIHRHRYDAIVSYSSIEHDGLGRYCDPINPVSAR